MKPEEIFIATDYDAHPDYEENRVHFEEWKEKKIECISKS